MKRIILAAVAAIAFTGCIDKPLPVVPVEPEPDCTEMGATPAQAAVMTYPECVMPPVIKQRVAAIKGMCVSQSASSSYSVGSMGVRYETGERFVTDYDRLFFYSSDCTGYFETQGPKAVQEYRLTSDENIGSYDHDNDFSTPPHGLHRYGIDMFDIDPITQAMTFDRHTIVTQLDATDYDQDGVTTWRVVFDGTEAEWQMLSDSHSQ